MEIKQNTFDTGGYFKALIEGRQAGLMTYIIDASGKIVIQHTEVEPEFNGQGIGNKLVVAAAEYAREMNKKVVPVCTFAKSVFERMADMKDVLDND